MTDPRGASPPTGAHNQRVIAGLVVALALVTGLVLGVGVDRRMLLRGPGRPPFGRFGLLHVGGRGGRSPTAWLDSELHLTPAQRVQVDSIVSRELALRAKLQDTIDVRLRTLMDSGRAAVDRVLTPEQRQKLAVLRAHRDSAREAARPRR